MVFSKAALLCALLILPVDGKQAGGSKSCSHTGFYSKKVVPLCEKHFPDDSSKHLWVVQFYHPYVQQVVSQQAAFEELASVPKKIDNAKVGAVDCQQNGEFCSKQGIREAPTTRVYLHGQKIDFEGEHTVENLRKFVKDATKRFAELEESLKCDKRGLFTDPKKDVALPLCASNFPPALDPYPWIVSFYETGERNKDKTMRSVLNRIAEKYGNVPPKKTDAKSKKPRKLRVGAIHCNHDSSNSCAQFGVTKFPTVRFYRTGAEPVDFDSFIDSDELKQWADGQLKSIPPPPEAELIKADMPEGDKKEL